MVEGPNNKLSNCASPRAWMSGIGTKAELEGSEIQLENLENFLMNIQFMNFK